MNRILSITNASGVMVEGEQMANTFVDHFENFLGKAVTVVHIDLVGDIFTNRLSDVDALDMVKEVTDKEIKEAMFDIDNYKAPGPDGYTACFFQKSLGDHWEGYM